MSELQLIDGTKVARHRELCAQFAAGLFATCTALWHIRQEKTYEVDGFDSYKDFLATLQMNVATGRLYANSGAILEALQSTGDDKLVTSVDTLRPIALLLSPQKQDADKQRWIIERQAHIVRVAAKVAKKGQEPLTEEVVARVAEANFGIKPRGKYKKKKKNGAESKGWEHPYRANVREAIAFCQVQLSGMSPEDAVHRAAAHRLPGFVDLAQWFADVVEQSARVSRDLWLDEGA